MASLRKKKTSRFWFACFTLPDGKRVQRSTKTTDKKTAMRLANEYEELTQRRMTANQARKVVTDLYRSLSGDELSKATTREFFRHWLSEKEPTVSESTISAYQDSASYFLEFMGDRADADIIYVTPSDISGFRDSVAKRLTAVTANMKLKIVRSAFQQAWREGYIDENPAAKVAPMKIKKKQERRAFTLSELKRLFAVATGEWEGLILTGLYTGQRLGDVCSLTWRNIDTKLDTVSLTTKKTGRRQILPLAPPLLSWIKKQKKPKDLNAPLFPETFADFDRTGRVSIISNRFAALMAQANLVPKPSRRKKIEGQGRTGKRTMSELSFHSLRHTATSLMKNAGVSPAIVQEFVGHDSKAISQAYTHIDTDALRAATNALPDLNR